MSRVNLGLHQSDVSVAWDLGPHDFSILRYWLEVTPSHVVGDEPQLHLPERSPTSRSSTSSTSRVRSRTSSSRGSPRASCAERRSSAHGRWSSTTTSSNEPVRIFDSGVMVDDPQSFGEFQLSYRTGEIVSPADAPARAAPARDGRLLPFDPYRRGAALLGRARRRGRADDRGGRRVARARTARGSSCCRRSELPRPDRRGRPEVALSARPREG